MKKIVIASLTLALLSGAAVLEAQDAPKETRLLQQIVGEWEYDSEAIFEPGKPALKSKGTESVRAVNGNGSSRKTGERSSTPPSPPS